MPAIVHRPSSVPHARRPLEDLSPRALQAAAELKRRWGRHCRVEVRMAAPLGRVRAVIVDGEWTLEGDIATTDEMALRELGERCDIAAYSEQVLRHRTRAASKTSAA